jgi:hypothetical protein
MMDERFREMISLIARARAQWCDCLGQPLPLREGCLPFSSSPAPLTPVPPPPRNPFSPLSTRSSARHVLARPRCSRLSTIVSAIIAASACRKVGAKLLNRRLRNQITDRDTGRGAHALFMDHTARRGATFSYAGGRARGAWSREHIGVDNSTALRKC